MLVFLSDVHLTDGSSGATIKATAFRIFAENLRKLADSVSPLEEIRVVLLDDIFDIIRSTMWVDATVSVRPWDPAGPLQEEVVTKILRGIIATNQESLDELRGGGGCLDRIQVFISGKLPLVYDHAAACLCDCVPK